MRGANCAGTSISETEMRGLKLAIALEAQQEQEGKKLKVCRSVELMGQEKRVGASVIERDIG